MSATELRNRQLTLSGRTRLICFTLNYTLRRAVCAVTVAGCQLFGIVWLVPAAAATMNVGSPKGALGVGAAKKDNKKQSLAGSSGVLFVQSLTLVNV